MRDETIEDEADEQVFSRIRRARLIGSPNANADWCDNCHGYTHMPWCSEYEEPAVTQCECGRLGHHDQIKRLPAGTQIESVVAIQQLGDSIPAETKGIVRDHCSDGRAIVFFDGYQHGHTFHEPNGMIRRASDEQPAPEHAAEIVNDHNQHQQCAAQLATVSAELEKMREVGKIIAWHRDGVAPDVPVTQERYDGMVQQLARLTSENERLREALRELGEYAAALELTYGVEQEAEQLRQSRELLNHATRGEGK